MSYDQLYKYGAWIMLILNIGLVSYFIFDNNKPDPPRHERPGKTKVKEMLGLDEDQQNTFISYADDHQDGLRALEKSQDKLIAEIFNQLTFPISNEESDSLYKLYETLESKKIKLTVNHLNDVRAILKEDQLQDFSKLIKHLLNNSFSRSRSKRRRPPPRGPRK